MVLGTLLVLVVLTMLCQRLASMSRRTRECASCTNAMERVYKETMTSVPQMDMDDPLRIPVSEQQKESARSWFASLTNACANSQVDVLLANMRKMPDVVTNMPDKVFWEVASPLHRYAKNDFWNVHRDFQDLDEFDRFVEIGMQAVNCYGSTVLKRHSFPGMLIVLDKSTLRVLTRYRDKFKNEGRRDFEEHAEKHVQTWIARMDADDGFVRARAFHEVDLQWGLVENGQLTRKKIYELVVNVILAGFDRLGYTPKWLGDLNKYCETKEKMN